MDWIIGVLKSFASWLFGEPLLGLFRRESEFDWAGYNQGEYDIYIRVGFFFLLAVMIAHTAWCYKREGKNPAGAKILLASLRIFAFCVLFLIAMNPSALWYNTRELHTDVVFLFDDSQSQSLNTDTHDADDLLKLASYVDITPSAAENLARIDLVKRSFLRKDSVVGKLWKHHPINIMSFSHNEGPYVRDLGRINLVGNNAMLASKDNLDILLTRLNDEKDQAFVKVLIKYPDRLSELNSPPLDSASEADLEKINTNRQRLARIILDDTLGSLKGKGYESKIPIALNMAMEKTRGKRVKAIVVVSDFQNTKEVQLTLEEVKRQAKKRGVPFYSVLVGSPSRPSEVQVTTLRANPRALRGSQMNFSVLLNYCNIESDTRCDIKLLRRQAGKKDAKWEQVAKSDEPVILTKDDGDTIADQRNRTLYSSEISISYEPADVGDFEFKAVVETKPALEASRKIEPPTVLVKVVDEKIKILLVSGDAGWEFQHLRNFLLRQPELYKVSVWQQNADKEVNQIASTGMKLLSLPRTEVELLGDVNDKEKHPGYNVVVLYDPKPTAGGFDGKFCELLNKFVADFGGGLCYIAGNKNTEKLQKNEEFLPLLHMLPVTLDYNTSRDRIFILGKTQESYPLQPTYYGEDHPIMMLDDSAEKSREIWAEMPGIYWTHAIGEPKQGARILAVNSNKKCRTKGNTDEPLVALQRFGLGRSLYLGSDETWRWVFLEDGKYHNRFWANCVRFLATLKPRLVEILLASGKDKFNIGEQIEIVVRAKNEKYEPVKGKTYTIIMVNQKTKTRHVVTLEAENQEKYPGKYTGQITAGEGDCGEGDYLLTVGLEGDKTTDENVVTRTFKVAVPDAETKRPEADTKQCARASTNGKYLYLWEIDKLAEMIPPGELIQKTPYRTSLWNTNLFLLLIFIPLCVEWILRKKYNMA